MGLCPNPVGYVTKKTGSDLGVKVPVNCKRWDCPHCGKVNKKRVLDRVAYGFKKGERVRGITLTERKAPDNQEAQNISEHWQRFKANLRKRGYNYKFFKTVEWKQLEGDTSPNPKLYPHLHVLINVYIPQAVIKHCWELATKHTANVVWVNASEIIKGAGYISKYLTKSMNDEHFKNHARRYSFSMRTVIDKDGNKKRVSDFPLYVYEEVIGIAAPGEKAPSLGFALKDVSTNGFIRPKEGEWEFTYDPGYWIRIAAAVDYKALAVEKIESLNHLVEFMEKSYPKGR